MAPKAQPGSGKRAEEDYRQGGLGEKGPWGGSFTQALWLGPSAGLGESGCSSSGLRFPICPAEPGPLSPGPFSLGIWYLCRRLGPGRQQGSCSGLASGQAHRCPGGQWSLGLRPGACLLSRGTALPYPPEASSLHPGLSRGHAWRRRPQSEGCSLRPPRCPHL